MKKYLLCILLPAFGFIHGNDDHIKLDGVLDETGWAAAKVYEMPAGNKLYVLRQGNELYIGIKATDPGWAHVYLHRNDSVHVLHASAALGEQLYTKNGTNWKLQRKFNWELRDALYNEVLQQKQEKYFLENGWVANNNRMGDKRSFEFRINLQAAANISFAALVTADAKSISAYPAGLPDDTLLKELVSGNSPDNLQFSPSAWANLAK